MDEEEFKKRKDAAATQAELQSIAPMSFEDYQKVFRKWLIIPDKGILKLLPAFYCANKLSRKAVWLIIIAPSGGGKTELLNSLLDLEDIYPLSTVTPNTFLSGMPGRGDMSLLPKLSGKIMLMKDWTTILSMQKDARAEVMAQLREIWDGSMKKPFGNGKIAEWKGKVSLLAASTQAVDMNQQQFTHLGERFLNYRLLMPGRKEAALRSLDNDADQELMAKELRHATFGLLKSLGLEEKKTTHPLSKEIKNQLVDLADLSTRARSGIIRDFGFKKEVIFVPTSEMPTRMAQQLNSIATGISMVNKGDVLTEDDMSILYKVALDSIPQTNKMVMTEMAKADFQTTAEIATALGYPSDPIRIYLENLAMLHVCTRVKGSGRADRWLMKEDYATILRNYEHIEMLTDKEIAERKELASEPSDIQAESDFETL